MSDDILFKFYMFEQSNLAEIFFSFYHSKRSLNHSLAYGICH